MAKLKIILAFIFLTVLYTLADAQTIFGANNYTEYQRGTLPVVISVPHDGSLIPASIPDRTCNNPTTVRDIYTIELAQQLDSAFLLLTGCRPHIIYCHLKRTKLDCNRNISDGACGNAEAETAWSEFNHFIDTAQQLANNEFPDKVIYIDLHAHGHTNQWLELGYLLNNTDLSFSDSVLNGATYIAKSSIQNLVANNANSLSHSELLRGKYALGTLLGNAGYPSVPSKQIPFPDTASYFNGGYNTSAHTCYTNGNHVNGLQIETNYTNVRDSKLNRKKFADSLAHIIIQYMQYHRGVIFNNCSTQSITPIFGEGIGIYPSVATNNSILYLSGKNIYNTPFTIHNMIGQKIESGSVTEENTLKIEKAFESGLYILTLYKNNYQHVYKIVIIEK